MVESVGQAPREGDHSGSPEAIPIDPYGMAQSGRQGKEPNHEEARAQRWGIWTALKGKYSFQGQVDIWENDSPSPAKVLPQRIVGQRSGALLAVPIWVFFCFCFFSGEGVIKLFENSL